MDIFNKHKWTIIITVVLCLAPIIFGVLNWDRLPEMMPTHFGFNDEANGYMKKEIAVFVLPALMAVLELVCVIASSIDPKKKNISSKTLIPIFWMMPALSWIASGVMYASALGYKLNVGAIFITFFGFLFLALGNYLPKNAHNYTVGVRTSWALNDENNWNYTNRIGGICFSAGGLALAVLGVLALITEGNKLFYALALVVLLVCVIIPIVASYMFYRNGNK